MKKTTTMRVVKEGVLTRVFMPDGTEITGLLAVEVSLGSSKERDIGRLTLVLADFTIDSSITPRVTEKRNEWNKAIAQFGLKPDDYAESERP